MKNNYRDNYYGSILDPLHGDIKLSEIEKWIIHQPIFSRLRKVKQNTFLYYVFPSANHTRFEHSIGVMHLAGKIFDSCKENFATGQKKKEKYSIKGESSFFNLNNLEEREEIYYQELRLAALLHDIGHGPLSHLFDKFAISKKSFLKIVNDSPVLKQYYSGFEKLIFSNKDKVEHEIISCAFVFQLIDELKKENIENVNKFSDSIKPHIESLSAERIVKLIEPDFENLEEFTDSEENNYTTLFSRIITAFPIDADRMDYLLRDSYFSGVTYGIYDINRIFTSFMATKIDSKIILAYKESGLDSMLRFIQSRSHLYNQVYFHKTNRSANTMLSYASQLKKQDKSKLLDDHQDLKTLRNFYIENSDEVFLNKTIRKKVIKNQIEKEVLDELLSRKLFKRVFQIKIILTNDKFSEFDQIKSIKDSINKKLENLISSDSIYATTDIYENKTFKDSNLKYIHIAEKNNDTYAFDSKWENVNNEFSIMNMNVVMVRIYLRRTFINSIDFEKKKKTILDLVSTEINELKELSKK